MATGKQKTEDGRQNDNPGSEPAEQKTGDGGQKTDGTKDNPSSDVRPLSSGSGPWVYVGPSDPKKFLRHRSAYLSIPAGADAALFVPLDDYPAWVMKQAKGE